MSERPSDGQSLFLWFKIIEYIKKQVVLSKATHDNLHINDIIDGCYDEKIFPE